MTLKEKLRDIRALINEVYEDETNPETLASRDCFRRYCSEIEGGLEELEKLEDIERELGIGLVALFKALKYGIWFREDYGNISGPHRPVLDYDGPILSLDYEFQYELKFKDYGKTWALTKEELV